MDCEPFLVERVWIDYFYWGVFVGWLTYWIAQTTLELLKKRFK